MTIPRAAVLVAPQTFDIRPLELPPPDAGEVRVRIEGCGVCASSIPVFEGREWFEYPLPSGAPGHESWGTIEAVGREVSGLRVGQRVASLGQRAFATHENVAADEVVVLPDELAGVPFPGEPLGCAMNIFRRADVREGDTVAIVGTGFLGCLLAGLCRSVGAKVIAVSRRETSLRRAESCGADEVVALMEPWAVTQRVEELTDGAMCERVIECAGKQSTLDVASALVKTRGTLVVAGYHQDGLRQVDMQSWNWRGIDVVNAHERDPAVYLDGVRAAVAAVVEGRIDPRPLFTHTFPLDAVGSALQAACERDGDFMKGLILMSEEGT